MEVVEIASIHRLAQQLVTIEIKHVLAESHC